MIRKIIEIDEEKCSGCGACANACHEGAIGMVEGKAKLLRDDYCDGMGDCLPECPVGAIRFTEREAAAYDAAAVAAHQSRSPLQNWPVQLKLSPIRSQCFAGAHLLIAADCTPVAYSGFHTDFLPRKTALLGCSKLDGVDYSIKLQGILAENDIRSITLLRMEVPCCGGLEMAARKALAASGKAIPLRVVTIGIDGAILEDRKDGAVQ